MFVYIVESSHVQLRIASLNTGDTLMPEITQIPYLKEAIGSRSHKKIIFEGRKTRIIDSRGTVTASYFRELVFVEVSCLGDVPDTDLGVSCA